MFKGLIYDLEWLPNHPFKLLSLSTILPLRPYVCRYKSSDVYINILLRRHQSLTQSFDVDLFVGFHDLLKLKFIKNAQFTHIKTFLKKKTFHCQR